MSHETITPYEPLNLSTDYSWIIFQILERKARTAIPLYLTSIDGSREPFFTTHGKIRDNEQFFWVDWNSLDLDAEILQQFIEYIKRSPQEQYSQAEVEAVSDLLRTSPLFSALESSSIIPSAEHCTTSGVPITPFEHIQDVALSMPQTPVLQFHDAHVARILPWLHDIGKMAAVAYLPQGASHLAQMQQFMRENFNRKSSHTYPAHAEVGSVILHRLLSNTAENAKLPLSDDEICLLLAVVFHHHHFIYRHNTADLEEKIVEDIQTRLEPTLPANRPDLIVRFFALLLQFRFADVLSSPAHHKHWPANVEWYSQLPNILKQRILPTDFDLNWLDYLQDVITALPQEISE